jgi:hypothetical protein
MPGPNQASRAQRLLRRLDDAWTAFRQSYDGLSEAELTEPHAIGEWSVKDILSHVTTWEREALKYLPLIAEGGRPPRYARYGGIDAFNAQMMEQARRLSLQQALADLDHTHQRLVDFVQEAPPKWLEGQTRFRRRLRLDTYGHYPLHATAIRAWREQRG